MAASNLVTASTMNTACRKADSGEREQSTDRCGCLTLWRKRKQPLAASTQYIDGKLSADDLMPLIKRFGNGGCLQWSTMQEGLCHFMLPDVGFIAYTMMEQPALADVLVLGDPICHASRWSELVDSFISVHKQAVFAQISREFGIFLSQNLGYYVNCFGGETELSVSSYSYSGGCKKGLRLAAAKCKRAGITVEEMQRPSPRLAINLTVAQQLRLVSKEWLSTKTTYAAKSWFLLRHPVFEHELQGTRTFVAWSPADNTPGTETPSSQTLAPHFADITTDQPCASNPSTTSAGTSYPLSTQMLHSDSLSVHSLLSSDSHQTHASTGRQAIGFVVLDPMYRNGQLIGYYANIVRTAADAPSGTAGLLIQAVLEKLRAEEQCSTSSSTSSSTLHMKPKRLTRKQRARLGAAAGRNGDPDVQACVHAEGMDSDNGQATTVAYHNANDYDSCAFPYSAKLQPIKTLSKRLSSHTQSSGMILSLGLSAMCCIKEDKQAFKHVPWVHQVFKWLWNNPKLTAPFYPFQGVAAAKAHYAGSLTGLLHAGKYSDPAVRWVPKWVAMGTSSSMLAGLDVYQMGRTMGMSSGVLGNTRAVIRHFCKAESTSSAPPMQNRGW